MRMDRRGASVAVVATTACGLLAGCGGGKPAVPPIIVLGDPLSTQTVAFSDGAGLRLPRHLDGFSRRSLGTEPKGRGVTAVYAGAEGGTPVAVTIRVRRVGGGRTLLTAPPAISTAARSSASLSRAIAALQSSDPGLSAGPAGDIFLVRFGAIQAGRTATLQGQGGPITVDAFCCVNAIWSYEFEVAGPGGDTTARFLRDLPWSASTGASIEEPQ